MTIYSVRTYQIRDMLSFALSAAVVLFAIYMIAIVFIGSQPKPKKDDIIRIREYLSNPKTDIWRNVDENGYALPGVYCVNLDCLDKVTRPVYCFSPLPPEPEKILFWVRKSKNFCLPISDYMIAYADYRFFNIDPFELLNTERPAYLVMGP